MKPLQPWADYFVTQAGASAALTGLIFVVLSFSFDHIVSDEVWLGRAGTGPILLAQPTIYGFVGLFATRTATPVAWVLAATALMAGAAVARIVLSTAGPALAGDPRELAARISLSLAGSLLVAAGALGLAAGWSGGIFFLSAGALASLAIGLVTAWVLLVEVRRLKACPASACRSKRLSSCSRALPVCLAGWSW